MPVATDKISFSHERKLIRKLAQQDMQIRELFKRYSDTTAAIMSKYRVASSQLWIKSPQLDQEITAATQQLKTGLEGMMKTNQQWAWLSANEKNDEILTDYIDRLQVSNIPREGLFQRNLQAFDTFVNRKIEGLNLSDRVWSIANEAQDMVGYYLQSGIATGRSANEMSRDIRQMLNKPNSLFRRVRNPETGKLELSRPASEYHPGRGVYRSAYKNAMRVARSETNMAYRAGDHERWKQTEWILGFEVKLSNAHPVTDICDSAAGRYPKDFRFIGWHPQCMCYAIPILPSPDEMLDNVFDGKPMDNMVTDVPEGFKEWVSKHTERVSGWNSQPFWVRDNFKGGRIENGLKDVFKPTVQQVVKATEFIPAQSINEAKQWAKQNMGIEYDTSTLNIEARNEINKTYYELKKEYPNRIVEFDDLRGKSYYASSSGVTMRFNVDLFNNIDKFIELEANNIDVRYLIGKPDVNPIHTTIIHEYAHSLTTFDIRTNTKIGKELKHLYKKYKNTISNYERIYGKSAKNYEHYISTYANKDVLEFVAEAFTQHKLYGEKSSKFSNAVISLINKNYKK